MVSNYFLDQMDHNDLFGSIGHLNRPVLWLNGGLKIMKIKTIKIIALANKVKGGKKKLSINIFFKCTNKNNIHYCLYI